MEGDHDIMVREYKGPLRTNQGSLDGNLTNCLVCTMIVFLRNAISFAFDTSIDWTSIYDSMIELCWYPEGIGLEPISYAYNGLD
jgi:hypothetical protein